MAALFLLTACFAAVISLWLSWALVSKNEKAATKKSRSFLMSF
jgi:hypothetical protein